MAKSLRRSKNPHVSKKNRRETETNVREKARTKRHWESLMRDEILRKIGDRYGAVGAFIGTLYGSIADPTSLPWVVEGVVCGLIGCAVAGNAAELSAKYELPHQSYAKIQSIYHLARDEIVQYIRGK